MDFLNSQWHKLGHSPEDKNFCEEFDELLDWHGVFSGAGDEIMQGPLWIRPDSLLDDAFYKNQVVGHTEVCIYDEVFLKRGENRAVFIDSPLHKIFGIFDTQKPHTFLSVDEFLKHRKKTLKIINDIKSQVPFHKDDENFFKKSLEEHFSKEIAEKIEEVYSK